MRVDSSFKFVAAQAKIWGRMYLAQERSFSVLDQSRQTSEMLANYKRFALRAEITGHKSDGSVCPDKMGYILGAIS